MNNPEVHNPQTPEVANQTGEKMLGDIGFFQKILETGSGLTDDMRRRVEEALEVSTERFNEAASFAAVLGSVVELYVSREQVTNYSMDLETLYPDLTPEQSQHVQEVISAMEGRFPSKTFELIKLPNEQNEEQKEEGPESTNKETANRLAVICTDQVGIDLGDPEQVFDSARNRQSIMANPEDDRFIIQTKEGKTYDTRTRHDPRSLQGSSTTLQ
jgi:hypothetical protein